MILALTKINRRKWTTPSYRISVLTVQWLFSGSFPILNIYLSIFYLIKSDTQYSNSSTTHGQQVWFAHTYQRNIHRPQLSSQFAVNLQKDLLSDAAEFLWLGDGPYVNGLWNKSHCDSDMICLTALKKAMSKRSTDESNVLKHLFVLV